MKDLPRAYIWRLERDSNPRATTLRSSLPMRHQVPQLISCVSVLLAQISCISDGVEKEQHRTARRKYCGERTTPLILTYSNCDSLTISFVTDSSHTSGGFQLKYTVKGKWSGPILRFWKKGLSSVLVSVAITALLTHGRKLAYISQKN